MRWWRSTTALAGVLTSIALTGAGETKDRNRDGSSSTTDRGDPVAVVKEVGDPEKINISFMDYLYEDQRFDLGQNLQLTIVYLANCRAETLTGGSVVIGLKKSRVTDGSISHETTACSQAETVTTARAQRAGATVVREGGRNDSAADDETGTVTGQQAQSKDYDSPHQNESNTETRWRIQGLQPVFKWQEQGLKPPFRVKVISLSGKPPRILWRTTTENNHAQYPDEAPELAVDTPYRMHVTGANQQRVNATFVSERKESSRDDPLAKLVPLGR